MANLWDDFLNFMPSSSTVGSALTGSLPTVLKGGMDLYSANQTQNANNRAAATAQQGTQAAIDAANQANQQNQAMLAQQRAQTQPGVSYLRGVTGINPGQLTPGQATGLDIARQQAQTQLATSGLRGAGQAQLDVMRGLDKSYIGDAVAANTARADNAAGTLAGENAAAVPTSAYLNQSTAGQVGAAAEKGALFPAQATTGNAAVGAQADGAVASDVNSLLSGSLARQRQSGYANAGTAPNVQGGGAAGAAPGTGQPNKPEFAMGGRVEPRALDQVSGVIAGQNKTNLARYAGNTGNPARAGTGVEDRYASRLRGGLHSAGASMAGASA